MHEFVDTYVKLLIAMISFVAPIMVLLLSVFNHGTINCKKQFDEEKKQIQNILSTQLTDFTKSQSDDLRRFITISSKQLNKSESEIKIKLNLLNPKRQIIRVFSVLFIALGFVMTNMLIRDISLGWYNHILSLSLLAISGSFLLYAMFILYQVGCIVIDTKTTIEEEKFATHLSKEA